MDRKFIAGTGLLAAVITVFGFLTGYDSLPVFFKREATPHPVFKITAHKQFEKYRTDITTLRDFTGQADAFLPGLKKDRNFETFFEEQKFWVILDKGRRGKHLSLLSQGSDGATFEVALEQLKGSEILIEPYEEFNSIVFVYHSHSRPWYSEDYLITVKNYASGWEWQITLEFRMSANEYSNRLRHDVFPEAIEGECKGNPIDFVLMDDLKIHQIYGRGNREIQKQEKKSVISINEITIDSQYEVDVGLSLNCPRIRQISRAQQTHRCRTDDWHCQGSYFGVERWIIQKTYDPSLRLYYGFGKNRKFLKKIDAEDFSDNIKFTLNSLTGEVSTE